MGSVGRIVCVCAVLEQQLTAMRHALAHVEQGKYTHQPVSEQIKAARALSQDLPHTAGERIRDFLSRADDAFDRRNESADVRRDLLGWRRFTRRKQ